MNRPYLSGTLLLLLLAWLPNSGRAHPGHGLVVTSDGRVIFTDIVRETIWLYTPGAGLTPLVADRWTHALALTPGGDLVYEAEHGRHPTYSLHRRAFPYTDEQTLIPRQSDPATFSGGVVATDGDGTVFFVYRERIEGEWQVEIRTRASDGTVQVLAGGPEGRRDGTGTAARFQGIDAMHYANGHLYVVDADRIRRVTRTGVVTTLTARLTEPMPPDPPFVNDNPRSWNRLYGLWVGPEETLYVAYHAGRRVLKLHPHREPETVYQAEAPWAPVGVYVHEGALYVLESGLASDSEQPGPRLRIVQDGHARTLVTVTS